MFVMLLFVCEPICQCHVRPWLFSFALHRGCLGRGMVLGSFQCRGVLLLWHMVGQGPTVLAAGAGRVGFFFFFFFFHLIYPVTF